MQKYAKNMQKKCKKNAKMELNSIIAKKCKNGMLVLHKPICNPNDY